MLHSFVIAAMSRIRVPIEPFRGERRGERWQLGIKCVRNGDFGAHQRDADDK